MDYYGYEDDDGPPNPGFVPGCLLALVVPLTGLAVIVTIELLRYFVLIPSK